jgi:hypothetical protein
MFVIPAAQESTNRRIMNQASPGSQKEPTQKGLAEWLKMQSIVEHLSIKQEGPEFNSSTGKKKKAKTFL